MNRRTKVPSIPDPTPDGLVDVARSVKNVLDVREGRAGDKQDRFVSFRDLEEMKLITDAKTKSEDPGDDGGNPDPNPGGYNPGTDYTTPPQPTGFRVNGGYGVIMLDWDTPQARYKNHAYTEIWRNSIDQLGTAVMIGTTIAAVYTDPVPASRTYYYWIRFVSQANVTGPYNSTSGTQGTSAIDVPAVLNALTGQITQSQLYSDLGARINLIDGDEGLPGSFAYRFRQMYDQNQAQFKYFERFYADLNSAVARQTTTLSTTVAGHTTSIQVNAESINGINAKYTVKIDNNGYVSGYGLISTANNGTPTSEFAVRADRFYVASPTGPGITPIVPFVVQTVQTTVNGVTVPVGVYMDAAYIKNGTITSAKIGDAVITNAKIADAAITSAKIGDAQITTAKIAETIQSSNWDLLNTLGWQINKNGAATFNQVTVRGTVYATAGSFTGSITAASGTIGGNIINSTGVQSANFVTGNPGAAGWRLASDGSASFKNINIYDSNGSLILSSGGKIPWSSLISIPNGVYNSEISIGADGSLYGGGGGQVTLNGLGAGSLATQNWVGIGSTVRIYNGSQWVTLNTGDFVNSLSRINASNIGTFMDAAAIGSAYIGNAAIQNANIATAAISTLKIDGEATMVPRYIAESKSNVYVSTSWSNDIATRDYTVSGLAAGESIRVLVIAILQAYPGDSAVSELRLGVFADGNLNAEVTSSFKDYGLTMAATGSWLVGNGTYAASIKVARGSSWVDKPGCAFQGQIIVMAAKR